jgi:hypothetical protein
MVVIATFGPLLITCSEFYPKNQKSRVPVEEEQSGVWSCAESPAPRSMSSHDFLWSKDELCGVRVLRDHRAGVYVVCAVR